MNKNKLNWENIKNYLLHYKTILACGTIGVLCICFYFSASLFVDLVLVACLLYFLYISKK